MLFSVEHTVIKMMTKGQWGSEAMTGITERNSE